jgi:hypothetical protein
LTANSVEEVNVIEENNREIKNKTKMKYLIINNKGGVGKSYKVKLLALKAEREGAETHFIDCDNASASMTKYFQGIRDRKPKNIKFASCNLIGPDKKIDRTMFDNFLGDIEKLENVVVDFGAASSDQLLYYIQEEASNDIIATLNELNVRLLLVIAGGGSTKECVEFFEFANSIPGIGAITHLIANEYHGGVGNKSVKEFTNSKVQIGRLHNDPNSEAQREWEQLMINGVVYADILKLNISRRRRIINYLDNIFNQINSL